MTRRRRGRRAKAIGHSLDVYWRDAARIERMDSLHCQFVQNGDLAFDIGAHVGDRSASFHRLGARVVAVEPQADLYRALRLIFHNNPNIHLEAKAVGAKEAELPLFINSRNPTVSTLSEDLVLAAPNDPGWHDQEWDLRRTVPVTTLDKLIAIHGCPKFIKIDVEGHEDAVLQGLSRAVRSLSFEVTTLQKDVAMKALRRLSQLGEYKFNLSLGEEHRLQQASWMTTEQMIECILSLPASANSGDVYARLVR